MGDPPFRNVMRTRNHPHYTTTPKVPSYMILQDFEPMGVFGWEYRRDGQATKVEFREFLEFLQGPATPKTASDHVRT